MWTLYDPLTKPAQADALRSRKIKSAACPSQGKRAPSTAEKLWFLLEPTSPLACRNGLRTKGN
jgi:hypothetical protein